MMPEPTLTVRELLAFYLEAGVDCALADEPVNRLVDDSNSAVVARPVERMLPPVASPAPFIAPPQALAPAPEAAIATALGT